MNKALAIVIPTYNRSEILEENLLLMLPQIEKFDIPVYISDDSSDNRTALIINKIHRKYPYIFYYKNNPSLGHDHNCLYTLSLPSQSYIWYLGDSMIIQNDGVEKILAIIKSHNPDFICCREENRSIDIKSKIFSSSKEVFKELGWHLTMSGVTIYKKSNLKLINFPLDKFRNFPQLAIIFYFFDENQSKLVWLNEKLIRGNLKKKSYWTHNVFSVFFDDLKSTLNNLPQKFNNNEVDAVIKAHSIKSQLFGIQNLLVLRISKSFNYKKLKEFSIDLKLYTDKNFVFLFLLSVFPSRLLGFIYKASRLFYRFFKNVLSH